MNDRRAHHDQLLAQLSPVSIFIFSTCLTFFKLSIGEPAHHCPILPLHCFMASTHTLEPPAYVFRLPEMLREIYSHCGLDVLVALAGVNSHLRSQVKSYILGLVCGQLRYFFPNHHGRYLCLYYATRCPHISTALSVFWDELHKACGVITGAVALAIVRNDQSQPTSGLAIVVPLGSSQSIRRHIIKSGYKLHSNVKLSRTLAGPCKSYTVFNSLHSLHCVTISESEDGSVLSHILGAPHTAWMNALTPTQIVSFYPYFTTANITLEAKHSPLDPVQFYGDMGLKFYQSVADLNCPCGIACPEVYRRVRGSRGVLSFDWDTERPQDLLPLASHSVDWRLGAHCINELCTFF